MESVTLENKIRIIYKKIQGSITSFSIGFEAGAIMDEDKYYGLAHVVEHMIYKGTKKYSENEINEKLDTLFGMSNAMTNYPYVIFYGTSLTEDFEEGLALHSELVQNPLFQYQGFPEEMNIIKEELKEWRDDSYKHCEDLCLSHGFKKRRIKELIIGNEESLNNITLEDVKDFHNKHYVADKCVISIVSSMDFEDAVEIVNNEFKYMKTSNLIERSNNVSNYYENNLPGIFRDSNNGNNTKVNIIYTIHNLSSREVLILRVFNNIFGEGVSSILYDEIRTKRALSYEVASKVKFEKGIKLFKIYFGTSKESARNSVDVTLSLIDNLKKRNIAISDYQLNKAIKSFKLKLNIELQNSLVHSVRLCTGELMKEADYHEELHNINIEDIYIVINKIFKEPTIEILD